MGVLKPTGIASPKRWLYHSGSHFLVRVKKYHIGPWGQPYHFNLFFKQPCSEVLPKKYCCKLGPNEERFQLRKEAIQEVVYQKL